MKKLILSIAVLAAVFVSCDDDHRFKVSPEVTQAFNTLYPNAVIREWEQKGAYSVVEFNYKGAESEAWFNANGKWFVTETDITILMLPEEVMTALKASEYATWRIDDVDLLERRDLESIYIIEVESGKIDKDLHYTATGQFLKATNGNNDDYYEYFPE